jgi:uncharacterized protein YjlB
MFRRPEVTVLRFRDDGKVPNSEFPALVYRGAFEPGLDREALSEAAERNGWYLDWMEPDAVFLFTHFHGTAHEALVVMAHHADLRLGGEEGQPLAVRAGDVVLIPAGVAHQRVSGHDEAFVVAGLYPRGQTWDLLRQNPADYEAAKKNIPALPLPSADPIYGADGPLLRYWAAER